MATGRRSRACRAGRSAEAEGSVGEGPGYTALSGTGAGTTQTPPGAAEGRAQEGTACRNLEGGREGGRRVREGERENPVPVGRRTVFLE